MSAALTSSVGLLLEAKEGEKATMRRVVARSASRHCLTSPEPSKSEVCISVGRNLLDVLAVVKHLRFEDVLLRSRGRHGGC